jgi:hypothetical protein
MRLVSLATALVLVGCADEGDEGMIVLNNTAVTGDSCSLSGDPGQPFSSHGEIYALADSGYILTPLIQSRIVTNIGGGSGGTGTVDTLQKTIQLLGADVVLTLKAQSIENADGSFSVTQPESNVGSFSTLFSGSLPPSGTVNVGFEVITPAIMRQIVGASGVNLATQALKAEVLAQVTIKGELGGDSIESKPFFYPISVCTDCVIVNRGTCPIMGTAASATNPCNVFQDGVVECCTDASNNLICPGPTE